MHVCDYVTNPIAYLPLITLNILSNDTLNIKIFKLQWRFRYSYMYMYVCVVFFHNKTPICLVFEALRYNSIFLTRRLLVSHRMFKYSAKK